LAMAEEALASFAHAGEPYVGMVNALIETFESVRRAAEDYRLSVLQLDAGSNEQTLLDEVRVRARTLNALIKPGAVHERLAQLIIQWLGMASMVNIGPNAAAGSAY
jgi:hypothetical protein